MHNSLIHFIFLLMLLLTASTAHAQTITETNPFNVGTIAITDNNAPRSLTVTRGGAVLADSQILLMGAAPSPAQYALSGFPASTALTIAITDTTLSSGLSPETFSLDNYEYTVNPGTDASGNYTMDIGYRLRTNGSGNMYADASYTGTLMITVNY